MIVVGIFGTEDYLRGKGRWLLVTGAGLLGIQSQFKEYSRETLLTVSNKGT